VSEQEFTRPDVLVLAGGGILGEAWMTALLAGIEAATGVNFTRTEHFVGTSAGAVVAGSLSAGRRPQAPSAAARRAGPDTSEAADPSAAGGGPTAETLRAATQMLLGAGAPLAPRALAAGAPGGALLRSLLLARAPEGSRSLHALERLFDESGVRFDGRLRIACVDRASGRRVVFGAPGAPAARVGRAIAASCAIPGVFRAVTIGGREYVDGGVWSPTNLDVAPAGRGTRVLCLNPTGSRPADAVSPLGAVRVAFRAAETVETLALRGRGADVDTIVPDQRSAAALGTDLMDADRRERVGAAAYRQGLSVGGRG
jgi:NTE family protein